MKKEDKLPDEFLLFPALGGGYCLLLGLMHPANEFTALVQIFLLLAAVIILMPICIYFLRRYIKQKRRDRYRVISKALEKALRSYK